MQESLILLREHWTVAYRVAHQSRIHLVECILCNFDRQILSVSNVMWLLQDRRLFTNHVWTNLIHIKGEPENNPHWKNSIYLRNSSRFSHQICNTYRGGFKRISLQYFVWFKNCNWGYSSELRRLSVLLHEADAQLFRKMINNKEHCIHQLLPPEKNSTYETSFL